MNNFTLISVALLLALPATASSNCGDAKFGERQQLMLQIDSSLRQELQLCGGAKRLLKQSLSLQKERAGLSATHAKKLSDDLLQYGVLMKKSEGVTKTLAKENLKLRRSSGLLGTLWVGTILLGGLLLLLL